MCSPLPAGVLQSAAEQFGRTSRTNENGLAPQLVDTALRSLTAKAAPRAEVDSGVSASCPDCQWMTSNRKYQLGPLG